MDAEASPAVLLGAAGIIFWLVLPAGGSSTLADAVAAQAAAELGIPTPAVRMVSSIPGACSPRANTVGCFDGRTIWVLSGQPDRELVNTVAHEVRHAAQWARGAVFDGATVPYRQRWQERDAEKYANGFTRRHGQFK